MISVVKAMVELLKGVRPKTPISVHFETPDATQISNQAAYLGKKNISSRISSLLFKFMSLYAIYF